MAPAIAIAFSLKRLRQGLVTERATTVVPAAYFDRLVASLDEPRDVPRLERAVRQATRRKRIKTRELPHRTAARREP
jgi:hypothetical protein